LFHEISDPVEIHYTLIKGINDSDLHIEGVSRLLDEFKIPLKIIRFNPVEGTERSDRYDEWLEQLRKNVPGLRIVIYDPPGKGVGSSCGEFTKHYYLSELETPEQRQEFTEWKAKYEIFE
jgi:adenine C2-methylase RlmN of 23S rRNA A2503 and tRNA A37